MTDAPERIHATASHDGGTGSWNKNRIDERFGLTQTEFVRADVAQAMAAKAREEREMFAWAMEAVAKARQDAFETGYHCGYTDCDRALGADSEKAWQECGIAAGKGETQ